MQCDAKSGLPWMVSGVLGLCFILMMLRFGVLPQAPLVVIDMNRAIQKPSVWLAQSKLSPKEQSHIMQRFSKCLPEVIQDYAKSQKVLVIASPVLGGTSALDITDAMIEKTLSRMKDAS